MIPVSEPSLGGNELRYLRDCLESGWISSSGAYLEKFEQGWADYCGVKYGVAVSSGTAALQISVDALGLGPGDEIVMPSFTIISCALAVVRAGATPVLVDCRPDTYCLDARQVADAITPKTRAIMPVHMYGHPADMDPLLDLAERHGLAIIEDAAQAHGSEYRSRRRGDARWRRAGSFGTVATFSFYANKLLTTGEGGMLLTDDRAIADRCRELRNLSFGTPRFVHRELGYNFRLTNIQAALGLAQLERMPQILERKRRMAALYDAAFEGVGGVKIPTQRNWAHSNYWMYSLLLDDDLDMSAERFAELLRDEGVDSRPFFVGMHRQPALLHRGFFGGLNFPVTDAISRRGLYIPSGLTLSDEDIETVAGAVRKVLPS